MATLEELRKKRSDLDKKLKAEKDPAKRAALTKERQGVNKGIISAKKGTTTENKGDPRDIKGMTTEEVSGKAKAEMGTAVGEGKKLAQDLIKPEDFRKLEEGRTEEEKATLERLKTEYEASKTRTPEAQLAMDKFKAGLEGLSSQEGMALQEQARRNLDTQYQTQMAQAKMAAARSGARGAAAGAQQMMLDRDRARAQGQLEQDLTVQNYGLKQQALQNFGSYVSQTDQAEAARRQASLGMLTGQENVVTDRGLETSKFNIGQDLARTNALIQTTLGGAGIYSSTAGNIYATDMATKAANEANRIARDQNALQREANQMYGQNINKNMPGQSTTRNTGTKKRTGSTSNTGTNNGQPAR